MWRHYGGSGGHTQQRTFLPPREIPRYQVTLYDGSGEVIESWTTEGLIKREGGGVSFTADGLHVIIGGTFVITEVKK